MSLSWFLYANDAVTGPFTTDEVTTQVDRGILPEDAFVWWRGEREWVPLTLWRVQLPGLLAATAHETYQSPVWYVELAGSRLGPITQTELIAHLKSLPELAKVLLWSAGMPTWSSLYELHGVMDLVGLSRRESERAPLMGKVRVGRSNDNPRAFTLQTASVSIGGLGMSGSHDLRPGDDISLSIESENLGSMVHVRGRVQYVSSRNFVGVKFVYPQAEVVTLIAEYVRRFIPLKAIENSEAA